MTDDRLPTHIYVMAHIRRFLADGIDAVIRRKGDPGGGLVLLKLIRIDRDAGFGFASRTEPVSRILTQTRDAEGRMAWFGAAKGAFLPEPEAEAYIERAIGRDPDLWVVEIESSDGRNPFDGEVI